MTQPDASRTPPPDPRRAADPATREDEVVQLCSELIRIDSVNTGDPPHRRRRGARRPRTSQEKLDEVGLRDRPIWSRSRAAATSICRLRGRRPEPRRAARARPHRRRAGRTPPSGRVDPFSGEIQDGCVWGRGAVDMKDMVAMTLAVARDFKRSGVRPAARPRLRVPGRRGGRRHVRARSGWSTTTPTCSRARPRRSARSAGSPSRSTRTPRLPGRRRPRRACLVRL